MSNFDDLFKSRLENHELDVPTDMWDRIQAAQAPEDSRKPFLLFWKYGIVATFLIGVMTFAWIYLPEDNVTTADKASSDQLLQAGILTANKEDMSSLLLASTDLEANEEKVLPIIHENMNISLDDMIKVDSKKTIGKKTEPIKAQIIVEDEGNDKVDKEIKYVSNDPKLSVKVDEIKKQNPSLLSLPIIDYNRIAVFPDHEKNCPKFGSSYHGYFSVEAFHSLDYNIKRLEAKNTEDLGYLESRSNSETKYYSYSNALKFKWHNNSGLAMGLGLERTRINEVFNFTDLDAREVKVLISIDTIFQADGSYTTSKDTTRIEIQGTVTNRILNSYTSIDLPLNIGYQMEFGKFAVGVHAGLNINLMFNPNGRILGLDGKPAWISNDEKNELDVYKQRSGLKFDGSISVIYHLTSNIDIMAEPYFRYNPNTLTRDNYSLNHFNNTIGLRTGLRYNFGF